MRRLVVIVVLFGSAAVAAPLAASPAGRDTRTVERQHSAVAVEHVAVPLLALRDEAAMVLVGTALIGLGAAVRRSA